MSLSSLKNEVKRTSVAYCEAKKGPRSVAAFLKLNRACMAYTAAFHLKAKNK